MEVVMSNVIPDKMVHLESWSANLLQVLNGSIGTPNVLSVRSRPVNTLLRDIRLNQLRKQRTTPRVLADENPADLVIETAKDLHALSVSKVEVKQVREAIMRLPLKFREVILLREYGELSYQEIATLLDCPPATVMSRLATARSKLRTLLAATGHSSLSPAVRHGSRR
jgi:predicted DNA-binding protein (UPF0251 family)